MSSFKFKLVLYFVVLSLLPLAAAFYGFTSVAKRSEERRVDARLQAGLRAAVTAYADELQSAQREAGRLARSRAVQEALRRHDRRALGRIARSAPEDVRFGRAGARLDALTAGRTVSVYSGGRLLGSVTALVRVNDALLRHLRRRAGLDPVDRLVAVRNGRVILGADLRGSRLPTPAGRTSVETLAAGKYRVLAAEPLREPRGISFVALSPESRAVAAASGTERRLFSALLASLLLIAVVAYMLSRSVVGRLRMLSQAAGAIAAGHFSQRVPAQGRDEFAALGRSFNDMASQLESRVAELETARHRLREASIRFGEALEATHDPEQLREVIVESAVEATGASGGVLESEGTRVTVGDPDVAGARLELPLTSTTRSFGRLILVGPRFGEDERDTAESLAGQAVIALENARLHAIVERQALLDGLTGLANRRRSDELLHLELSRAARLAAPLAFVLADVDHFKKVNDRLGHPAGDIVLREVAALLKETLREIDSAGRWGGEEFAVILPGTDLAGGVQLAERLRGALAGRTITTGDGVEIAVTASFGIAAFPEHPTEAGLVAAADAALYEAKRSGRNRVVADQPRLPSESGVGPTTSS